VNGLTDDRSRRVAYELLRAVSDRGAYANLELPKLIGANRLDARAAAFATELGYGTARATGTLDEIVAACSDRAATKIDPPVRDLLRLGAYQLLRTRVPPHAAVASTVELAKHTGNARSSGFVNAVMRRVSADDWLGWTDRLSADSAPIARLARRYAHPEWIAAAFAAALGDDADGELDETERALAADD
jgi:16S rRNA (cytosine967-C5)-methyltransferase